MADTGAKHPLWAPKRTFRTDMTSQIVFVNGTGHTTHIGPGQVEAVPDEVIQFRNGAFVADAQVLYRIRNRVTKEEMVIDQVEYMLRHPQFLDKDYAPNARGGPAAWHLERGDEDPMKTLELAMAAERARPGQISPEHMARLGAAVIASRQRADKAFGPRVVRGVRDESANPPIQPADDPGPDVILREARYANDFRTVLQGKEK